jgi:hypothetical protein
MIIGERAWGRALAAALLPTSVEAPRGGTAKQEDL